MTTVGGAIAAAGVTSIVSPPTLQGMTAQLGGKMHLLPCID
eukprot:SAG11_NODE_34023_length_274_cov_0.594286_1_plen_40_part_01